jgi:restriction system protein
MTDEQQVIKYENTSDIIFLSRVRSVRYSLKKENYIEEVNKLTYQITNDGLDLLSENTHEIEEEIEELEKVIDPLTVVKEKINELKQELAETLLKQLRNVHWIKFEDIVIELLTVMGYGDGEVTQRSNDEGLDGIIKEDKLGLDNIYVQAKRYNASNSVGRDIVQSFSGALDGKRARKGVFITTSYFTDNAKNYAKQLGEAKKIILIDGKELAKLMIDHNVGVDISQTFVLKSIDYDYFKDE